VRQRRTCAARVCEAKQRLQVDGTEGAGRRLYRAAEGASTCGPRVPCGRRRHHAVAGLRLESEPGAMSGKDPTGGSRLAVRERGRERGAKMGWEEGG
jgi:hypothetical protein